MNERPDLLPADCLVYTGFDAIDLAIRCHTFSKACHVEFYCGGGFSIAARSSGVDRFPVRWDGLWRVYRPKTRVDMDAVMKAFYGGLQGQKYDWAGVTLGFLYAQLRENPKRKFCSETQTILYRAGGFEPFQSNYIADRVPPMLYTASAAMDLIYESA